MRYMKSPIKDKRMTTLKKVFMDDRYTHGIKIYINVK